MSKRAHDYDVKYDYEGPIKQVSDYDIKDIYYEVATKTTGEEFSTILGDPGMNAQLELKMTSILRCFVVHLFFDIRI